MRMGMGMQLGRSILGSLIAAGSTLLNGLVSYWPLNEQSGTRYDAVGSNDLTDNNTVGAVNRGPVGTVAVLDRTNQENFSLASFVNASTWTFSSWFKAPDATNYSVIFSKQLSTFGNSSVVDFYFANGANPTVVIGSGTDFVQVNATQSQVEGLNWHLYSVTLDTDKKPRIYIDGVLAATGAALVGSPQTASGTLNIGKAADTLSNGSGNVGRAGYWSSALSAGTLAAIFASGNGKTYADLTTAEKVGLVSYWNLDEVSGTRVDAHGANDLTDNNTVGSVVNAGGAMDGAAASFVAANTEYLSIDNVTLPSPPLTISAWFKSSQDTTRANLIFGMVGTSWPNYALGIHKAWDDLGPSFIVANGPFGIYQQNYITTAQKATLGFNGQWHHVVAWVDTDKVPHLTVDGVAALGVDGGDLGASPVFTGPATLKIGHRTYDFQGTIYEGGIDEVSVWNRVLTSDERTELYNAGAGKYYPFA